MIRAKQLLRTRRIYAFAGIIIVFFTSNLAISSDLTEILISSPQKQISPIESPEHWSNISNNSNVDIFTRRKAIFCLLLRHLKIGMKLSEIADILRIDNWLSVKDITQINNELIDFPIDPECLLNGAVFSIAVLPRKLPGLAVTFVFSKPIDIKDFYKKINGQKANNLIDPELVQMHFWGYDFYTINYDLKDPPNL